MRKIFNDDSLQQSFTPAGYVRVPMLSDLEVRELLAQISMLRPDDGFGRTTRFRSTYHCSYLDTSIEYKREAAALLTRYFKPHIERYLNGFNLLTCNFYVKPPGKGEFEVHQNWPIISDLNDTTVTVWCPLVDTVETNGAIQVVHGSHKIIPHVEGPGCPPYFQDFYQTLIDKYLKPIPMSAGEALIFDDGLIHWSANNDSNGPRIAVQITCVPADSKPARYSWNPANPDRFELLSADAEFFLATDVTQFGVRQPTDTSLGFVENRNRLITEEEFQALLKNGDEIRRHVYAADGH